MSLEAVVRKKVRSILSMVDLETTTQRSIQKTLEDDLGVGLNEYKPAITEEVERYLYEQACRLRDTGEANMSKKRSIGDVQRQTCEAPTTLVGEESKVPKMNIDLNKYSDDTMASKGTSSWRKETMEEVLKKPKLAETTPSDDTAVPEGYLWCAPIASKRFAGVKTYHGKTLIDVREFYESGEGKLNPGSKGLSMTLEQWNQLTSSMDEINKALERHDETYMKELGGNKRVSTGLFHGKVMVSLREFYLDKTKDVMAPGKRGISLAIDQWTKLCAVSEDLSKVLPSKESKPSSAMTTDTALGAPEMDFVPQPDFKSNGPIISDENFNTAQRQSWNPAIAVQEVISTDVNGPGNTSPAVVSGTGPLLSIELAPFRRAEVVRFKGRLGIDLREFYVKDGAMCHGRKGIQLTPEQFRILCSAADEIATKLSSGDTSFEVSLSNRRKATISQFKGRKFADIREYYEKDGTLKPGQKGISLSPDQFEKLRQNLSQLTSTLESAAK